MCSSVYRGYSHITTQHTGYIYIYIRTHTHIHTAIIMDNDNNKNTAGTSRISASFTIFACTISGGLLALPRVFYENTFFPSFILIFIAAITTGGSLYALILLSYLNKDINSYGTLVHWLGGIRLEKLVELIIGIFLTGVLGGSFIIIHDYIMLQTAPYAFINGHLITIGIAFVIALLSLPTNIGRLAIAGTGSVLSFCFLAFTLVYYGIDEWSKWPHPSGQPANGTNHSSHHIPSSNSSSIPWFPVKKAGTDDSSGSLIISTGLALPPILYAFGCQIQIFDIYHSVKKRKGKDRLQDFLCCIFSAIIGMTFTFTLVGFFGVVSSTEVRSCFFNKAPLTSHFFHTPCTTVGISR
jgi:amino acid permease